MRRNAKLYIVIRKSRSSDETVTAYGWLNLFNGRFGGAASRSAIGREGEVTNGCFVEFRCTEAKFSGTAAL